jgi:hypothetical protein
MVISEKIPSKSGYSGTFFAKESSELVALAHLKLKSTSVTQRSRLAIETEVGFTTVKFLIFQKHPICEVDSEKSYIWSEGTYWL